MPDPILDKAILHQNLDSIIEKIHMLVIMNNPDGVVTYANPHFFKLTGFSDVDIIGKTMFKTFVPIAKTESVAKINSAVLNDRYSMESESPVLRKDGSQLIVAWHNFPILADNKAVGIISIGIDITSRVEIELLQSLNAKTLKERAELYLKQNIELEATKEKTQKLLDEEKELESALQIEKKSVEQKVEQRTSELNEEKARLIASINSFPYGFLMTDNDGSVVVTNEKLAALFNLRKRAWQIEDLDDFLGEASNFLGSFRQVVSSKVPCLVKNIDLERKFLDVYISPIFLSPLSSDTAGFLVLVSDVTEQKILERSKDEFLSIASHELRTPLTAIRGNIELIKKHFSAKFNDESFNEMIDDIHVSSQRLIELVNEFLNMSRLEQGKLRLESEIFDVCSLITESIVEIKANADAKGLAVDYVPPEQQPPNVIADKNRVREVLINLIGNAIMYTDRGKITINVAHDDTFVKILVSDTGKGIPPQSQNMLFRKFQQANANLYTRDASRSTGLGLYISKLMVESMGGSIFLEKSVVGRGSTFVFTIPIAQAKKRL
jgi:two-component system, OmpR family, phosphate regulon sensor histidine kinase PhoR